MAEHEQCLAVERDESLWRTYGLPKLSHQRIAHQTEFGIDKFIA